MNTILATLIFLMASSSVFASNKIDGKAFCRTVVSDGMFGQPQGERQHCIRFANGIAIDEADTFFGNPPEHAPYTLKGRILIFGSSKYVVSKDLSDLVTINGSTIEGTVFLAK